MYPILLQLGHFHIYAYGFFIVMGFAITVFIAIPKIRKSKIKISFENVADLFFYTVLSTLLGSRILFGLIHFDVYRRHPIDLFKLWEGGLVFYGGFILAAIVALWYMRRHRLPIWKLADLISPLIALGLSFGRIGCFFAGCCYGKETSLPWGVIFKNPESLARLNVPLHPTQLYDAANGLAIFFLLTWWEKRKTFDGQIFLLFLFFYSMIRFFIEIFRGDPRGFLFVDLLSTSQVISILLAVSSLFVLIYIKNMYRRKKDGGFRNSQISSSHFKETF
jgi:phosphatidylglycerol:prolipoprotein diacylglycerol transferase